MKCALRLCLLLCAFGLALPSAFGQITLPKSVETSLGKILQVTATTPAKTILWSTSNPNLQLIPPHLLKDSKTAIVLSIHPGKYKLFAFVDSEPGKATSAAWCWIIIGEPGSDPVIPPPSPPTPDPDPPRPTDPLISKLQATYGADASPDKKQTLGNLIAFYESAAKTADNAAITSWGNLFRTMTAASKSLGTWGKLQATQGVIAEVLRKELPDKSSASWNGDSRRLARQTFLRIAKALGEVK